MRLADGRAVILKSLRPDASPRAASRLKNELAVGSLLPEEPTILKSRALETVRGRPILVMDDFAGEPLDRLLGHPMATGLFLNIAVQLCRALAVLHERRIIHRDIKPQSVLFNPATNDAKLADLGIATLVAGQHVDPADTALIEGTLAYMSPEQTGRMGRAVDHRTDFYSSGVTFYEMLAGTLPFNAGNPLEWVHCHVARAPRPLLAAAPETPRALSDIVMKLLAKAAEDRYQSASSLLSDLVRCREQWTAGGRIEPFSLADDDVSSRFRVPRRVLGRDRELAELLRAFDDLVTTGGPAMVLITGGSGVGKTALVNALLESIVRRPGYLVASKFDERRREIPYATVAQAFRSLVLRVLTEDEPSIDMWRARMDAALGLNARLIIDLVPEVALIIGDKPAVPELPLREAEGRFYLVFRRFLGLFATRDHPVTLFLDDLHWGDTASLNLLQHLLSHPDMRFFFVIGASRDREEDEASCPLAELHGAGSIAYRLTLAPLSVEHTVDYVAETVQRPAEEAEPLGRFVHEMTSGNPLFCAHFLNALHDERLIYFDPSAHRFRWDVARAREEKLTDNVVDLLLRKLRRLDAATQGALERAACVGGTVPFSTLAVIEGAPEEAVHLALSGAVDEGLLLRSSGAYKFVHDRVQQAAYSLIPAERRCSAHLRIGRALLTDAEDNGSLADKIFDVVRQLNQGVPLIECPGERERLAELNLLAGNKAMSASAYAAAVRYYGHGIRLLGPSHWTTRYELERDLHLSLARCAWISGSFDEAERCLEIALPRAGSKIDETKIFGLMTDIHVTRGEYQKGVEVALIGLRRHGIDLPARPPRAAVMAEYERLKKNLGPRTIEELVALPAMTDAELAALVEAFTSFCSPMTHVDDNLVDLFVCKMTNIVLEFGLSPSSPPVLAALGSHAPKLGSFTEGYRFCELARRLVDAGVSLAAKTSIYNSLSLACVWVRPLDEAIELASAGLEAALAAGAQDFVCYHHYQRVLFKLAAGHALEEVDREIEVGIEAANAAKFLPMAGALVAARRLVVRLQGTTDHDFDADVSESELSSRSVSPASGVYPVCRLIACCLWGDHQAAIAAGEVAKDWLWSAVAHALIPYYHMFMALSLSAASRAAPSGEQPAYAAKIRVHESKLEELSEANPEGFSGMHALVAAEASRIASRDREAMRLYQVAIKAAQQSGFAHHEAVAYEVASEFYREQGFDVIADAYLREARSAYVRWGALGKVKDIDRRFPSLAEEMSPLPATSTFKATPVDFDLLSVLSASQAISGELQPPRLHETLMRIVLEQSSADKGLLILCQRGGEPATIGAKAGIEGGEVRATLVPATPVSSRDVPMSVVNYVARTQQKVVLGDAAAPSVFASDEYLRRERPRSLLCIPIVSQARRLGVLYLENTLVPHAFTQRTLTALDLLSAQAAISLENATLYTALQESHERLRAILDNSTALIYMKDLEGRYVLANHCFESLFQGAMGEVVGRTDAELFSEETALARGEWDLRAMEAPAPLQCEEVMARGGERHTYLSTRFSLRDASGAPYALCGISTDITERKRTEEERQLLLEQAQSAVSVRDTFLSVASHELRTPLMPLQLRIQRLLRAVRTKRELPPERLAEDLEIAERQTQRLTRLIDDMLDLTRLQTKGLELCPEEVDFGELVRGIVSGYADVLALSGSKLSLEVDADVSGCWDRSRIDQVVINLLSNAIKFGCGKPLCIRIAGAPAQVSLSVTDRGDGIPEADQDRIFAKFERAVSTRNYGGLGLGLYITRQVVEAHGGTISVESRVGVGSTFTVTLPRRTTAGA